MLTLISPVALAATEEDRRRCLYQSALPSLPLELRALPAAERMPERLNSAEDVRLMSSEFGRLPGTAQEQRIVPDCMLDPGVEFAEGHPRIRWLFRLVVDALRSTGRRVELVSRNSAMADRMSWLIARYEAQDVCTASHDLRIPASRAFDGACWAEAIGERRRDGWEAEALTCCTGVTFCERTASEIRAVSPYQLIGGQEDELGAWMLGASPSSDGNGSRHDF